MISTEPVSTSDAVLRKPNLYNNFRHVFHAVASHFAPYEKHYVLHNFRKNSCIASVREMSRWNKDDPSSIFKVHANILWDYRSPT